MRKLKPRNIFKVILTPFILSLFLLSMGFDGVAQYARVVPYNGSSSQQVSPQGSHRYLRQFFLIPESEIDASDLENGDVIDLIGFTIGSPQDTMIAAKFRVYLQNTTDILSRYDTSWTYDTISATALVNSGFFPGDYEWQVGTLCNGNSTFSELASYSSDPLPLCNEPDSLYESNITESTATLNWNVLPSGGFSHFLIEYRSSSSTTWISDTTSANSYELTGLDPDQQYLWQVKAICAAENSPFSGSSFQTGYIPGCDAPVDLTIDVVGDTTVMISWTQVDTPTYFEIRYRRAGSDYWFSTAAIGESHEFTTGLIPGTQYEWEVRAICDTEKSIWAIGPNFVTDGDLVCYPPLGLMTTQITSTSSIFSWLGVPDAVDYVIRYRLKKTITWDHAVAEMETVHNDSILIPEIAGPYFTPFENGTSFTYDGGGLYVALEYENGLGELSSPNTALCNKQIIEPYSFATKLDITDTGPGEILSCTQLRPETWFGSSTLKDSAAVEGVYALGYQAVPYSNPQAVMARISNFASQSSDFTVTLTVKSQETGETRYTVDQEVTIAANTTVNVSFTGWAPSEVGTDSIIVSIPPQDGETVVENNRGWYIQVVNRNLISYADQSDALESASFGLGSGEGLILNRHYMNGCGTVIGAHIFLDYSARGQSMYAVVVDDSGNIVGQSPNMIPDSTEVNQYRSFYFNTPADFVDEDFYIGLAQTQGTTPYYPVGVQWEGTYVRPMASYYAALDGTGLSDAFAEGRFMIKGEIIAGGPQPFIYGDEILCEGTSTTLEVGSRTVRYANKVIDFSSQFSDEAYGTNQLLGVENVYPMHELMPDAWICETADQGREYFELEFPNPSPINYIRIFETFNPGTVDTVYVKDPNSGTFVEVYADSAMAQDTFARILDIEFDMTLFDVSEIRIAMNDTAVLGFNAIDAVAIGQVHRPGTFDTYTWSPGGSTDASIPISEDGSYSVDVTSGGCSSTAHFEVTTPVVTVPTIAAIGPTTFCEGESVVLKSSFIGNNTWSTGATTDSIIVDTSGTFTVTHFDGCVSSTSDPITITVNVLPEVSIDGAVICQGESTTLDAGDGYTDYNWSTGATTQTISVDYTGFFIVTVTDVNGCVGSGAVVTTVQIPPDPQISGDLAFCPGESTTLDAGAGFSTYEWSTDATSRFVTVSTPGAFDVTVTDTYGCIGDDMVVVSEYLPPDPFISGALGICGGSSTQLDAGDGFVSYQWSTGEQTQTIFVDTSGTFSVTVTDLNGCTGTAEATTSTEGSIPESPGPISGPTEGLCNASGVIYSIAPVPNASFYVWTLPEGMMIVNGAGTTTITVDVDNTLTSGNIVVAASNACGQSPSIDPTYLSVQGIPDAPGSITGPSSGICNQSGATYSISLVPGATSYMWSVPSGYAILSGQGTPSISIVFGSEPGDICVAAYNDCGGSVQSCMTVSVPVFSVDAGDCEFVFPGVPPLDCIDLFAVVTGGVEPFSFVWTNLFGVVVGTTQSITVCPEVNMSFLVVVTDANGCTTLDKVEVETIEATCKGNKVLVCHAGKTLCLSPGAAQNHLNHGDNLGSCDAEPCGGNENYYSNVQIYTGNEYEFGDVDMEYQPGMEDLILFPNPADDYVYLDLRGFGNTPVDISVYHSLAGKTIQMDAHSVGQDLVKLDMSQYPAGIFIVSVRNDEGMCISKTLVISKD